MSKTARNSYKLVSHSLSVIRCRIRSLVVATAIVGKWQPLNLKCRDSPRVTWLVIP